MWSALDCCSFSHREKELHPPDRFHQPAAPEARVRTLPCHHRGEPGAAAPHLDDHPLHHRRNDSDRAGKGPGSGSRSAIAVLSSGGKRSASCSPCWRSRSSIRCLTTWRRSGAGDGPFLAPGLRADRLGLLRYQVGGIREIRGRDWTLMRHWPRPWPVRFINIFPMPAEKNAHDDARTKA